MDLSHLIKRVSLVRNQDVATALALGSVLFRKSPVLKGTFLKRTPLQEAAHHMDSLCKKFLSSHIDLSVPIMMWVWGRVVREERSVIEVDIGVDGAKSVINVESRRDHG